MVHSQKAGYMLDSLDSDPVFTKFQNDELVEYYTIQHSIGTQDYVTLSLLNFHLTREFKRLHKNINEV